MKTYYALVLFPDLPSLTLVFDYSQYARTERKGLVDHVGLTTIQFLTYSMQKQRGKACDHLSRERHQCFDPTTEHLQSKKVAVHCSRWRLQVQHAHFWLGGGSPPLSTWQHSRDKIDQALLLCFCILSKTGRLEGPGMRLVHMTCTW